MKQTHKPLRPNFKATDCNRLGDLLYAFAKNIENSLVQAGAVSGQDYTINDLYGWAVQLAVEWLRMIRGSDRAKNFTFDTEF